MPQCSSSTAHPPTDFRTISVSCRVPQAARIEFTEIPRRATHKFSLRVRDPGAPAMCIQVNEEKPTIARMKAAGTPILSANGEIVDFGGGTFTIFVQDPNGMNLEVFERNPPAGRNGGQR